MLLQILDELAAFRARPNEAHFSLQHGPGLRQFIDAQFSQPVTKAGNARIVLFRPDRLPRHFGVLPHGAQLHDPEFLAIKADALLTIKGRPLAIQLHQQRAQQDDRSGQDQQDQAGHDVENALGDAGQSAPGRKSIRKDQPAGIDAGKVDAAGFPLQEARQVVDMDARRLDAQQVRHRNGVPPFFQGKHDLAGIQAHDEIGQIIDGVAVNGFGNYLLAIVHCNIADHQKSRSAAAFQLADAIGAIACPQHHQPSLECFTAQHRPQQQTDQQQHRNRQPHRVKRIGPPQGDGWQQKIENGQENDAQRYSHKQPGQCKSDRLERFRAIDPYSDHRGLNGKGEAQEWCQARGHRLYIHADLMRTQYPASFGRSDQEQEIQQPQQKYRMRYIMFEQPDHRCASPSHRH